MILNRMYLRIGLFSVVFAICSATFVTLANNENLDARGIAAHDPKACMAMTSPGLAGERLLRVAEIKSGQYKLPFPGDAEVVPQFQSIRLFPATGRLPKNAQLRVLFFHGSAGAYSHCKSMTQHMYLLGHQGKDFSRKSLAKMIRGLPNFVHIAAECMDGPFHGLGSRDELLYDQDELARYYAGYLRQARAETPNLKLVVFTRSSSANILFEVVKRYPGLIDGMVLMSPTVPVKEWYESALQKLRALAAKGEIEMNEKGAHWIMSLLSHSKWDKETLKNIPTLILSGDSDFERDAGELIFLQGLAAVSPNINLLNIPHAEHDVLRPTDSGQYDKPQILETVRAIEDFFSKFAIP